MQKRGELAMHEIAQNQDYLENIRRDWVDGKAIGALPER
jgi:hypothetical protein